MIRSFLILINLAKFTWKKQIENCWHIYFYRLYYYQLTLDLNVQNSLCHLINTHETLSSLHHVIISLNRAIIYKDLKCSTASFYYNSFLFVSDLLRIVSLVYFLLSRCMVWAILPLPITLNYFLCKLYNNNSWK